MRSPRRCATPTLVIHGALDYRVPDQRGLACYNTLQAREVDSRLLWFPTRTRILKPRATTGSGTPSSSPGSERHALSG